MDRSIKDQIMALLTSPLSVTELKKKLPKVKSFGTLAYHLKKLEKEGVITKEKNKKERGQPTTYKIVSKEQLKFLQQWENKNRSDKLAFVKFVSDHPSSEHEYSLRELEKQGFDPEHMADTTSDAVNENLVTIHYNITQKGKNFIKSQDH